MKIRHARRWSVGVAVALVAFGITAFTPGADAANPPVSLSPTSGPAGTTTTVTLPSACGSAASSSSLSLSAFPAGGGPGGGSAFVTIPAGGSVGSAGLTLSAGSPAGSYFVDGACSGSTFTSYGRAVFEVTGGPPLLPLTVTPTSGPAGTVVDVSGQCAPGTGQSAVLSIAMFSPSDPDNIAYGSASGVGPVLHASLTVPASFPTGPVTVSGSCFDYYATQYAFAQSSFTITGGPSGLGVTSSSSPRTVTAGGLVRTHFSINNAGPGTIAAAVVQATVPAGAMPVSITTSKGTCSGFTGTHATCMLSGIPAGGSRGVDVVFVTPPDASGALLATVDVTTDDEQTAHGSGGPTVIAARPGSTRGFVPPGGSISTGGSPTAENNTVATFILPKSGPGAAITLRAETDRTGEFCGGRPCSGKILYLSPFAGYDDLRHPPILKIVWDETVAGRGIDADLYVQKEVDGPIVKVADCRDTEIHLADPHPCIHERTQRGSGDIEYEILLISGDPRFARR